LTSHNSKEYARQYRATHKDYINARLRDYRAKRSADKKALDAKVAYDKRHNLNAFTLAEADKHRMPWDGDEIESLIALADTGCAMEEIALSLGRSYHAVCSELKRIRRAEEA
jgi:hypothetical protein